MNILLTGAAGGIGTAFRQYVSEQKQTDYWLRLADRAKIDRQPQASEAEIMQVDIAQLADCQRACANIDTVIHLAADPSPHADFYGSLLDNNIKGTYNIFQAAQTQGCRRVIYASSVQAVEGYPLDRQVNSQMPVRPPNLYGVSKCFGEAIAACFAHQGLSSIAVRIGAFTASPPRQTPSARNLSAYVTPSDLCQLLVRCIEVPDIQFAIVHGISENRFKRLDLTETKALLGYAPQDDAFQLFNLPFEG